MSYLVTDAEVRALIATADPLKSLTPFIRPAHLIVDQHLSDKGLSADLMKEIELWLSAHFTGISEQIASSESAGKVSQSFQYKLDLNLQATMFGQQAIALDYTGTLASLSKGSLGQIQFDFVGGYERADT